jgi:hypothetical protein
MGATAPMGARAATATILATGVGTAATAVTGAMAATGAKDAPVARAAAEPTAASRRRKRRPLRPLPPRPPTPALRLPRRIKPRLAARLASAGRQCEADEWHRSCRGVDDPTLSDALASHAGAPPSAEPREALLCGKAALRRGIARLVCAALGDIPIFDELFTWHMRCFPGYAIPPR